MSKTTDNKLIVPALGPLYGGLHTFAETLLRVVCGIALVAHGWGKITDPFGAAGMVESLGFAPGALWSFLLSTGEFFSGVLLIIGLLVRPAALVATVILLVTVYAHWIAWGEGYSGAETSLLWAAITFFFFVRGANRHSLDARIGRQF